jgi:alanyl-tRNA synthetase
VGFIKLLSSERIQDGVVRLEFKSLENSLKEVQHHDRLLKEVSDLWGVGYDDIPKTASRFFNEWKELSKQNKELQSQMVRALIESALGTADDTVDLSLPAGDFGTVMKVVETVKPRFKGKTVILKGDNFAYGYSETVNMKDKLGEGYMNVTGSEREARAFKAKPKA